MKEVLALAEQTLKQAIAVPAKPILKWAGGKTQMLGDLLPKVPSSYGRYIGKWFAELCRMNLQHAVRKNTINHIREFCASY